MVSAAGMNGKLCVCSEAVIIIFSAHLHRCCAPGGRAETHRASQRCVTPSPSQWKLHTSVCLCASAKLKGTCCASGCRRGLRVDWKNFPCIKTFSHTRFIAQTRCCVNYDIRATLYIPVRGYWAAWEPALSAVIKVEFMFVLCSLAISRSTGDDNLSRCAPFYTRLRLFLVIKKRVACSVSIQAATYIIILTILALGFAFFWIQA